MTSEVFGLIESSPASGGTDWEHIILWVAALSKTSVTAILGKSRERRVAVPRQVVCYLARELTAMSLKEIGFKLGRDHSTVIYSVARVEQALLEKDLLYERLVQQGLGRFNSTTKAVWRLEIVDPDLEGISVSAPGLRVIYERPDGSEWVAALVMTRRNR